MQVHPKGQMKLGWLMSPAGNHPAAWLHPHAELHGANNFPHYVRLVRKAESAKFDFVFQADAAGARDGNMNALSRAPRFMNIWEPLSLLSALAGVTERIGLAGTSARQATSQTATPRRLTSPQCTNLALMSLAAHPGRFAHRYDRGRISAVLA